MRRLLAALIAVIPAAFAQDAPKDPWKPFDVALKPGGVHEECMRVEKGDRRRYYWKSDGPVDFNIHYHKDAEVFYPVRRDGMRGDGGTFDPKSAEEYCWMWTARNAPTRVEGRIELR